MFLIFYTIITTCKYMYRRKVSRLPAEPPGRPATSIKYCTRYSIILTVVCCRRHDKEKRE